MPRSRITSRSKDVIDDNGAVLVSVIKGEQIRLGFTASWLTNMTDYTIIAKVVEADNSNIDYAAAEEDDRYPTSVLSGGQVEILPIIDTEPTDNSFEIVIPETLIDNYATQPTPNKPVYGFLGVEIRDLGVGDEQLVWKPFRGMVEILYSPTEA